MDTYMVKADRSKWKVSICHSPGKGKALITRAEPSPLTLPSMRKKVDVLACPFSLLLVFHRAVELIDLLSLVGDVVDPLAGEIAHTQ